MTAVKDLTDRWCPRCQMHWNVPSPKVAEYHAIAVGRRTMYLLRNAARTFDALTEPGEYWTAEEFVDWLSADLRESS